MREDSMSFALLNPGADFLLLQTRVLFGKHFPSFVSIVDLFGHQTLFRNHFV